MQAKTWGGRPSDMAGISDPVVAYAFDDALFHRVLAAMPREGQAAPPPGQRFANDADYAD